MLKKSHLKKDDAKKPQRSVTWASDDKLTEVRFYQPGERHVDTSSEYLMPPFPRSRPLGRVIERVVDDENNDAPWRQENSWTGLLALGTMSAGMFAAAVGVPFSNISTMRVLGAGSALIIVREVFSFVASDSNVSSNRYSLWASHDEALVSEKYSELMTQQKRFGR